MKMLTSEFWKKYFEFRNHFVFVAYPYAKVGFNATG